jgi:hypothetical protein
MNGFHNLFRMNGTRFAPIAAGWIMGKMVAEKENIDNIPQNPEVGATTT